MHRSIAIIILTVLLICTFCAEDAFAQSNELPLYGRLYGVNPPKELQQADEQFKRSVIKASGSPEKGSDYFADRAWEAYGDRQFGFAMRRANQSWLLNNRNYRAYWVMALVQKANGASHSEVDALFRMAIRYVSKTGKARLMQDYQAFLREM